MARISSAGTQIWIGDGTAAVDLTPSAVTKAKPAVMTVADETGVKVGDLVHITGANFPTLNDRVFRVSAVDATLHTITLGGSDTTNETATFAATNWKVQSYAAAEVCLTTFGRSSPAAAQIDVTTMCDEARARVPGLPDSGTFTFAGFYNSEDAGLKVLRGFYAANENRPIAIIPRDKSILAFWGAITSISESFGVDQAVTISGDGLVAGPVIYGDKGAAA